MATPKVILATEPSEGLEFTLTADDSAPQTALRLTNTLEDGAVAFKVKTTKPKRYLVKPNQGIVQPGDAESVSIQLLAPEKKVILSEYAASNAWDDSNKFLVQSVALSPDFVAEYNAAQPKDQTAMLTDLWGDQSKIKREVRQKKLTVTFKSDATAIEKARSGASLTLHKAVESAKDSVAHARNSTALPAGSSSTGNNNSSSGNRHSSSGGNDDQLWEEVKVLRSKYNDLVAFTVNLTAEKDLIQRSLDTTKEELQREVGLRRNLEQQSDANARRSAPNKLSAAGSSSLAANNSSSSGFSFLSLVIAALVAFFIGQYM